MKLVHVLGLVVLAAVVAETTAKPTSDQYIFEDLNETIKTVAARFQQRIAEVTQKIKETSEAIRTASGLVKVELEARLRDLASELRSITAELRQEIAKIFRPREKNYVLNTVREKVSTLITLIAERSSELSKILFELAKAKAQPKIEELMQLKDQLIQEIENLRTQLRQKIREMFVPNDDTYSISENQYVISDVVGQIGQKIRNVAAILREKGLELKTAVGEKRRELELTINQLREELALLFVQLKQAMREMISGKGTYTFENDSQYGIVDKAREIREAIMEKIQIVQEQVETAKMLGGMAREEALKTIEELRKQITQLKDDLFVEMRKLLGRE